MKAGIGSMTNLNGCQASKSLLNSPKCNFKLGHQTCFQGEETDINEPECLSETEMIQMKMFL